MVLSSNNKSLLSAAALIVIMCASACQTSTTSENETIEVEADLKKRPDMSELAVLMRKMDKLTSDWRTAVIEADYSTVEIPDWLSKLHTAEATDPDEINDIYHSMADAWIEAVNQFKAASIPDKPGAFNTLVTNCVNCHQQFCQGPIPKIKKLYVDIPQHLSDSRN